MASIVKRNNKYSVVYYFIDESGAKKQKWESYSNKKDAERRKREIEKMDLLSSNSHMNSEDVKLSEFLQSFISTYGVNNWSASTFKHREGIIHNYILPALGGYKLSEFTCKQIDQFYLELLKTQSVVVNNRQPKNQYLTASTVREVHKVLNCAFKQAVKWGILEKNPAENASLPKVNNNVRIIWGADEIKSAFSNCDDDILLLSMNLAFACTLRLGEILGITLDCIHVTKETIESNSSYLVVEKVLQRVNRDVIQKLGEKDIYYKFPAVASARDTVLVLKKPKTESSIRKVFLPKAVAELVLERIKDIDEMKEFFGSEYLDYNLLICTPNGRPIEHQNISRAFKKLIKKENLPDVVFHSLRHSSITYKLKLSGGDMKSVQGDSGHAQMKMVADVYSHILDESRAENAKRMQEYFYNDDITGDNIIEETTEDQDLELLFNKLMANPDAIRKLKSMLN